MSCPICQIDLSAFGDEPSAAEHVNTCLDAQAAVATCWCPLCGRDLTPFDFVVRTLHIEGCTGISTNTGNSLLDEDLDFDTSRSRKRKAAAMASSASQHVDSPALKSIGVPIKPEDPAPTSGTLNPSESASLLDSLLSADLLPMNGDLQLNLDAFIDQTPSHSMLHARRLQCFICYKSISDLSLTARIRHFRQCAVDSGTSLHVVAEALGLIAGVQVPSASAATIAQSPTNVKSTTRLWQQCFSFSPSLVACNSRCTRTERFWRLPNGERIHNTASTYYRSYLSTPFSVTSYHSSLIRRSIQSHSAQNQPRSPRHRWNFGSEPLSVERNVELPVAEPNPIASEPESEAMTAPDFPVNEDLLDDQINWESDLRGIGLSQFEFNITASQLQLPVHEPIASQDCVGSSSSSAVPAAIAPVVTFAQPSSRLSLRRNRVLQSQ